MVEDQAIEKVRTAVNIIDVISSYLPLTQKGKNYFGVCPFHEDHSPSMSVSTDKQIYKCFSCGAGGNVFTFVKDYENVTFIEAVKIVADRYGIPFSGLKKTNKPKTYVKEYEIMDLSLKFYQNNLNSSMGKKAKEYLNNRSLNDETIKEFNIGLALDYNHTLNKLLISKKYDVETLVNLGLINRNGENISDIFQNRIIFPIHNLEGQPIGFTGRIYESSNTAKYINSKETIIFKKGEILFNYHRAREYIKKEKQVLIVEGNMDAIRMYSSGIKNVVALMGTSLTKEQINIIKSLRTQVILMLDNDDAGETATYTNGNLLEKAGLNLKVVRLSGEKDPDEYIIKNGVDALKNNIKAPLDFLEFKLKYLKKNKDLSKTDDLVKYIKEIINNIKDIEDNLTKEITLKKMSEEYEISYELLKNELEKLPVKANIVKKDEKKLAKNTFSKYDIAVRNIIFYMMNDKVYVENFKKNLGYVENKLYRELINEIIYYTEQTKNIDLASFISYISTKENIYDDLMDIIKCNKKEELNLKDFLEFIDAAKNLMLKEEIKQLKEEIKNELDSNKKLELANKLIEIKKGCVGK